MWGQSRLGANRDGAGILLLIGFGMAAATSLWRREKPWRPPLPPPDPALLKRWWWALPAIPLAAVCFYLTYSDSRSYGLTVRLWLISLGLLVCPFLIRSSKLTGGELLTGTFSSPPSQKVRNWEIVLSAFLLLVAIAYRLPYLERFPALIHVDEANCGLMGMEIIDEWKRDRLDWFKPRSFFYFHNLGYIPSALFQVLFPPNLFGLRLSNVFLGLLALMLLYPVVRDLLGRTAGIVVLGMGAVAHGAVHWSRDGIHCGHVHFLLSVCAWHAWKAAATGRAIWFLLLGFWCGVCFLTYNAALATPVWLFFVGALLFVFSKRFRKRYWITLPLPIVGFLVFMAPIVGWWVKAPDTFMNRSGSMVFTKDATSVKHVKSIYGEDYFWPLVKDNFEKIALVINKTPDSSTQYGFKQGGFVDPIAAATFVLGLGVALPRLLNFRYWVLLSGIFINVLLGGILTLDAPQYPRISGIVILAGVPSAIWAREVYMSATTAFGRFGRIFTSLAFAAGFVLMAWINFDLYFRKYDHFDRLEWDYRHSCIVRDARDDGPRNFTYVYKNGFPVDFRQRANLFVAHSRRFGIFVDPEDVRIPFDENCGRMTFVFPTGNRGLTEKLKGRFPEGRLESRPAPFRQSPIVYDRYIVYENPDAKE
jgi:4-amino-4-deoxy-L-arabinose transferase-like glycosyltransferase